MQSRKTRDLSQCGSTIGNGLPVLLRPVVSFQKGWRSRWPPKGLAVKGYESVNATYFQIPLPTQTMNEGTNDLTSGYKGVSSKFMPGIHGTKSWFPTKSVSNSNEFCVNVENMDLVWSVTVFRLLLHLVYKMCNTYATKCFWDFFHLSLN